ncbi:hypothetical protein LTR78_009366 [Recurvomyces mirabilis]|uniref:BZIP domain-containing protein n=1 Tax=Recurvomyces mirabilis TaxID=574656 RepID=A0AAE0WGK5_9PEZI|nr:hypothetical protein LTR78_009366 [Recurvomyces mirabilis]
MSASPPYEQDGALQSAHFGDPAFDPNSGFDFAGFSDGVLRAMHDTHSAHLGICDAGGYSELGIGASQSLFTSGSFPVDIEVSALDMGYSVDPAEVTPDASISTGDFTSTRASHFQPPTSQTSIAAARSDSVGEKHGQITLLGSTPPGVGGHKSSTVFSQSGRTIKPNKSERARHAANQRHAKSKQTCEACASSNSMNVAEDGEEDPEVRKEKYRKKNRIATAKCRAKKKDNTEGIEEQFRALQASHNFLTREARRLRDDYSTLRTLALQHAPDPPRCNCSQIYIYNQYQAGEVVRNLGPPEVNSPMDSLLSPSLSGGLARMGSFSSGPLAGTYDRSQSISSSADGAFVPATAPNMCNPAVVAPSNNVQQDFSRYLQTSAEQGGFRS